MLQRTTTCIPCLTCSAVEPVLSVKSHMVASVWPRDRHAGWEIPWREIEILRYPDGSDWLLGEGRYGRVYKALMGGVQVSGRAMLIG